MKTKTCLDCQKLIKTESLRCRSCNSKVLWANGTREPSGKNGHGWGWKGGKVLHSAGYIMLYKPEHPRASKQTHYVLEHIVVWEEAHQKPLPDGWHIHHLNGIKSDNRPINLVALPSKKHSIVLAEKAKRIQELEALLNNQRQLI